MASLTYVVKLCRGLRAVRAADGARGSESLTGARCEGHSAGDSRSGESSPNSLQQVPAPRCHLSLKTGGEQALLSLMSKLREGATRLVRPWNPQHLRSRRRHTGSRGEEPLPRCSLFHTCRSFPGSSSQSYVQVIGSRLTTTQ